MSIDDENTTANKRGQVSEKMKFNCAYTSLVDIDTLIPNPKNPNKHPQNQIELLAKIIKTQGQRSPIVVSKRSGFIVKGHGRLLALLRLGYKQAAIDLQDYENEALEYADMVADNKIAELSESDMSQINLDVLELGPDFDTDLLGIPGFEIEPLDLLKEETENDIPEVKESVTVLGDVYELGNHRLVCGDSTDSNTFEKLMNGEAAEMVFTDPPYGMNVVKADGNIGGERTGSIVGKSQFHKAKVGVYKPIIGDDKPYDPTHLMNMAELKIIWGANHFSDKLPCSPHWIVWHKEMPEGTDFSGAELAWTNIDKKAVKVFKFTWAGMTRQGDRKDELIKRVHPTQKPVGLFADILNHYKPKSVIDVFGGSGSTLIACEKTNRKCFMMELDPHYCDVIVSRYVKYSGNNQIKKNGEPITWVVQ